MPDYFLDYVGELGVFFMKCQKLVHINENCQREAMIKCFIMQKSLGNSYVINVCNKHKPNSPYAKKIGEK